MRKMFHIMKIKIATILLLSGFLTHVLYAQKPTQGQVIGERVPLYCGSTGSAGADSTRLPVMFQLKVLGLKPGASYKYFTRFISLSDTADSTSTGTGIPIILEKTGSWRNIASPDLSTSGGHDTIILAPGIGEFSGWFGAFYNNDSRFAPGKFIYPLVVLQEIDTLSTPVMKSYVADSIEVLRFSTQSAAGNGTAVFGSSGVRAKSIVCLYDNINGFTSRPVSITYAENDGFTQGNMQTWYNNRVNSVAGAWGTILPNTLSSGITRIESRDFLRDTIIYANTDADGIWGSDTTSNLRGGAVKPLSIKSDFAPLMKPEFDFIVNTSNVTESNSVQRIIVRRRYGNQDTTKVSAFVIAGTATQGADYTIGTNFPMTFAPYGTRVDTLKVNILEDQYGEPVEDIAIRLNNPVNAAIGFQTTHTININDNDISAIRFDKKSVFVKENHGLLKVKLRMEPGSFGTRSVRVAVKQKSDSTSIPGEFKLGSSNRDTLVRFGGNKLKDSLEFNINIINDNFSELYNDTILLVLRSPEAPAVVGADSLLMLVIEDDDIASLYNFATARMTVKENVGSVKLRINRKLGNSFQSDIVLSYDASPNNAQPGADFTFSSQLLSFDNTNPDSFILNVPIINDNLSELRQDAVFYIRSSFNARIGKPDTLRVTILDDDLPEYTIARVSNAKAPNFVPDSLNVRCALRGVVYGGNMGPVGSPAGLSFTLVDNTGGIQVFNASGSKGYTVTEGDSLQVYGKITQFNGMTQLSQLDTIIKLGSGRTLKTPLVVSLLNELTESRLVKYNLVKLANPAQWPTTALAANTSVTLKVLTASDSFNLVIDSETDIDGKPAPSGFFNVAGIGAQNDASAPYTSNYLLVPRRMTDFTNLVVPVFGFTSANSGGIENRDSTEGFTLQCANLTSPQQITLVIKGGTAIRNTDYQSNGSRLFILSPSVPSVLVKTKLNDDANFEPNETIIWVIRENGWGTVIGPDSLHTVTIIDDESNSIGESTVNALTRVYPNPAADVLHVAVQDAVISEIRVYDANGRLVKQTEIQDLSNATLSASDLSPGLYTLTVRTDRGLAVKAISIRH